MIDWSKMVTRQEQDASAEQEQRRLDKLRRQALVDGIVVQVHGLNFQGDEISQGRMLRRADTMQEGSSTSWVLADNSIVPVTKEQLRLAAKLSVEEMNRIWLS